MPDLDSLVEAQAGIVAAWQEKVAKAAPSTAQEYTRALAVAVDKYATLKMVEREGLGPLGPECIARPGDVVTLSHDGISVETLDRLGKEWREKAPDVLLVVVDRRTAEVDVKGEA